MRIDDRMRDPFLFISGESLWTPSVEPLLAEHEFLRKSGVEIREYYREQESEESIERFFSCSAGQLTVEVIESANALLFCSTFFLEQGHNLRHGVGLSKKAVTLLISLIDQKFDDRLYLYFRSTALNSVQREQFADTIYTQLDENRKTLLPFSDQQRFPLAEYSSVKGKRIEHKPEAQRPRKVVVFKEGEEFDSALFEAAADAGTQMDLRPVLLPGSSVICWSSESGDTQLLQHSSRKFELYLSPTAKHDAAMSLAQQHCRRHWGNQFETQWVVGGETHFPTAAGHVVDNMSTLQVVKHTPPTDRKFEKFRHCNHPIAIKQSSLLQLQSAEQRICNRFPWAIRQIRQLFNKMKIGFHLGVERIKLPNILLVGPPGNGKSSLSLALGETLGLPTRLISTAGTNDAMSIQGSAKGWGSATPSPIVEFVVDEQCANPSIIVDEIDKGATSRHNGRMVDILHLMLDPTTASHWEDPVLGRCDLSLISWIATANRIDLLPASLLNRFVVINLPPPSGQWIHQIVHNTIRNWGEQMGVQNRALLPCLNEAEWRVIEQRFGGRSFSMRTVQRTIEALLAYKLGHPEQVH